MKPPIPPPIAFDRAPWGVWVTRNDVNDGLDDDCRTDQLKMDDLWEKVEAGEMTEEEYHEAIGPTRGYRPVDVYGPYTERQAEAVAAYLSQPEVAAEYDIMTAVPGRLLRFMLNSLASKG